MRKTIVYSHFLVIIITMNVFYKKGEGIMGLVESDLQRDKSRLKVAGLLLPSQPK